MFYKLKQDLCILVNDIKYYIVIYPILEELFSEFSFFRMALYKNLIGSP